MGLYAETLTPLSRGDQPAEALLDEILAAGCERRAAKIHFEPHEEGLVVRFRIGGGLVEVLRLPPPAANDLLGHVRGGVRVRGREIAAATMATAQGLRVVLHLDAPEPRAEGLEALGMPPRLVRALDVAMGRGGGLVLVAGTPGAGKRTTLGALLRHLDNGSRCLLDASADGPEALRAAIGQDADVILAGTIADRAGAAAAVRAAEGGHLVLASVEARDAVAAILQLREWRVEPFQLASTLQAVLAQRLVDRLCPDCREPVQAVGSVSALLGFDPGAVVYAPAGCEACGGTGFAGRTAVFEAILADAALRRLINDGGDGAIIARHAFLNAPNLGSAARALVRAGITTPEEAVKVSRS